MLLQAHRVVGRQTDNVARRVDGESVAIPSAKVTQMNDLAIGLPEHCLAIEFTNNHTGIVDTIGPAVVYAWRIQISPTGCLVPHECMVVSNRIAAGTNDLTGVVDCANSNFLAIWG